MIDVSILTASVGGGRHIVLGIVHREAAQRVALLPESAESRAEWLGHQPAASRDGKGIALRPADGQLAGQVVGCPRFGGFCKHIPGQGGDCIFIAETVVRFSLLTGIESAKLASGRVVTHLAKTPFAAYAISDAVAHLHFADFHFILEKHLAQLHVLVEQADTFVVRQQPAVVHRVQLRTEAISFVTRGMEDKGAKLVGLQRPYILQGSRHVEHLGTRTDNRWPVLDACGWAVVGSKGIQSGSSLLATGFLFSSLCLQFRHRLLPAHTRTALPARDSYSQQK